MPNQHEQPHAQDQEAPADAEQADTQAAPRAEQQSGSAEQRSKTLAIRVEESLHTQLRFIAQLNGTSITEEIRRAITDRITTAQDDPNLIARAEQAQQEIEREPAARTAALAGFIGKPAIDATVESTPDRPSNPRRRSAPSNK